MLNLKEAINTELDKIPEDDKDVAEDNIIIHEKSWLDAIQNICEHHYVKRWPLGSLNKMCNEKQK